MRLTGETRGNPDALDPCTAGNMLAKFLDFNAFLFNLGPGVLLTSPPVFYFLVHYFKDNVSAP